MTEPVDSKPGDPHEIPAGKMRVWDAENKKVLLVDAPVGARDRITLTIRIHDAAERKNAKLSASWYSQEVAREDLKLSPADFAAKYLIPALTQLEHFKPQT